MKNITPIILIILSLGIYYTFTSVELDEVKTLQALSGEYINLLDNASQIVDKRDSLLVSYRNIPQAELDAMAIVLPDNIDAVRSALDLDGIAGKHGVSITSLRAEATPSNARLIHRQDDSSPYDVATFTFTFVSNYNNFIDFLTDLEHSLRIMDVKSINFQVGESGIYEHRVTVDTYWLK